MARSGIVTRWQAQSSASLYRSLPARVRDAIRAQQDASEVLIGWIQLAVVLIFGTLWAISPKTVSSEAALPVPITLAAYLLFTVLRLYLAYRHRLPQWMLALSVVIDMGLLLVLIWTFHLQYDQPPSFYLKAPTLLYVFIFIALRALRFEARFVILAGLVAAAGWGMMIIYVLFSNPEDTMITRNYVTYLTSNSILLGAEFDKIVSILVVTTIIALAIHRARTLLVRSVAEEAAARELSRFFSPEIADRIKSSEERITAGHGLFREAAILTIDVRGFTALAQKHPADEVIAYLCEYQRRVVPVVQDNQGTIDKFLGDGILATFGAAAPSEAPAAEALRSVEGILATIDDWNRERVAAGDEPVRIGAAVAYGRVLFGAVGDATRLEYTVIGDPVNLAAKLEKHTKAEQVRALTTIDAYEAAAAQGYRYQGKLDIRRRRDVAGVADPVDIVVLGA
ncbi:MAG: adenylate/guanylate cyclase domain-containing protein [Alphaproteobacteria bacterium]|nr:adenylate/guanylate cyclase domain-containing protein [Alphaproteobacteria bacterium]